MMNNKGVFIVFEGLDGSGKTAQLKALSERLKCLGIEPLLEREPSDRTIGLVARGIIERTYSISSIPAALAFAADRYDHVEKVIKPAIEGGVHVLVDRFILSNYAYQGIDCSFEDIDNFNKHVFSLLMPDLTIFIDTAPQECLNRIDNTRTEKELYDLKGIEIRESYYRAIKWLDGRLKVLIIDGNRPFDVIAENIWENIREFFISE